MGEVVKMVISSQLFVAFAIFGCSASKQPFETQDTPPSAEMALLDSHNVPNDEMSLGGIFECRIATQEPSSAAQKNILRLGRRERNCGQHYRLDELVLETKDEIVIELQNVLDVPITVSHACGLTKGTLSVVVEGANDQWGTNTGYGILDEGCVLMPGKFLRIAIDVKKGENLSNHLAREASGRMKKGCYTARLASAGYLMDFTFKLCLTE